MKMIICCGPDMDHRTKFNHACFMTPYHDLSFACFLRWRWWMNGFLWVCVCVRGVTHTSTVHSLSQTKAGCISAWPWWRTRDEEGGHSRSDNCLHTLKRTHTNLNNTSANGSCVRVSPRGCVWWLTGCFLDSPPPPSPRSFCVWSAHKQTRGEHCRIYSVWSEGVQRPDIV